MASLAFISLKYHFQFNNKYSVIQIKVYKGGVHAMNGTHKKQAALEGCNMEMLISTINSVDAIEIWPLILMLFGFIALNDQGLL